MSLKTNRSSRLAVALLAILPLLFLWRVAFKGDILLSLDMLLTYEPWRSEIPGSIAYPLWNELMADPLRLFYPIALYIRESWRSGQIPFWYPYGGNGLPILSMGYFQVLYPVNNILWQIIPIQQAFGWSVILHLFLGSLFTFLFAKEVGARPFGGVVAAIAFTYSSSMIMWLGLLSTVSTMIWMPFIFWALERAIRRNDWRWSLLAACGAAIQILSGQIQLVLYTYTALVMYALCRVAIIRFAGNSAWAVASSPLVYTIIVLIAGGGLAAFQLLPLAEIVPTISRGEGDVALQNPLLALLRLFVPDLLGTNIDGLTMPGYRFEVYLYIGLLPLFFMAASLFAPGAWLTRALVGMGVLFLLVIFNAPPFYQLFYYFYPTFPTLGLVRTMFIIAFWWAVSAGLGADWLLTHRPPVALKNLISLGGAIGSIALLYLAGLALIAKSENRHFWGLPQLPEFLPSVEYHISSLVLFLVILGAVLLVLQAWKNHQLSSRLFAGCSIGLIVVDLFLTHIDFAPVLPQHLLYPSTPSLSYLQEKVKQETEPYRISGVGRVLWPNTGGVFSLPVVQVYDSFLSRRYHDYAEASGVRAASNLRVVTYQAKPSRLLDALNVKYLYTPRDLLAADDGVSLLNEVESPQVISDDRVAGQVFEWAISNWSQRVLAAPTPTTINYQGVLPKNMRLETALAIDPQFWDLDGVRFEIYAVKPGQSSAVPLFSQIVSPRENPNDRAWIPVQVDLSDYAGQPVALSFVTTPLNSPGTRAGWADPMLVNANDWELLYYGPNSIYKNKQALPRAWIVHQATSVPLGDIAAAKTELTRPNFDPAVEAVVEGELPALAQPAAPESVEITRYHPSRIQISAALSSPGLLVLSDLYYPGWQVYVDGQPQPLRATNLAMRGAYLDSGARDVVFAYEPFWFKVGLTLSGGVVLAITIALVISYRARKL